MGPGVHELQLIDAHFGVDRRGFGFFVTEELLDEADIGSVVVHVGSTGVAKEMTTAGAADVGFLDEPGDHAREHVGVEGFAVAGQEQGALGVVQDETGSHFVKVAHQSCEGSFSDRHHAVFVSFALAHLDGLAIAV